MVVTILGGTTMDVFVSGLPRLPQMDPAGDEFTITSLVEVPHPPVFTIGGNGANAGCVLATLGCQVRLVTSLGADLPGRLVTEWLRTTGCKLTILPPTDATPVNIIATDVRQRRYAFFHPVRPGSAAALALLPDVPMGQGDHLLLAGYPHVPLPVMQAWADQANARGASVAIDIGPVLAGFRLETLAPLLPSVDVLYCNGQELRALSSGNSEERITEALLLHLKGAVVVKRGERGATFVDRHGRTDVPAFLVKAVTSVGAGDAFNAAFIYKYLIERTGPQESLRFASALVALMLQRGQGTLAAPGAADVNAFLRSQ